MLLKNEVESLLVSAVVLSDERFTELCAGLQQQANERNLRNRLFNKMNEDSFIKNKEIDNAPDKTEPKELES
jgi:hypothetical protein